MGRAHPGGLDPRTPVLTGVGESSERLGEPGYCRLSPADLAARAATEALTDTGAGAGPAAVAAAIDVVAAVRQFEISGPWGRAPLGRSANFPRSVAARIGAAPGRAILGVTGGHVPQQLVTEMAAAIAAGHAEVALITGAEAISTVRRYAREPGRPDFTEDPGGSLEDRGYGLDGMFTAWEASHGLVSAVSQYALIENARRTRLGWTRARYAAAMGELLAPFTRVAAANPHAASRVVRTPAELATPSERNRPVADPYTRYLVAREKVNQGAAVLLTSVAAARRLRIPAERWVFLHGHAGLSEQSLLARPDLSAAPACTAAARHALEIAGITVADLATIDLYSCFPVAVSAICDGLGLDPADPRGLTVTGGLPFFGGPGNDYSLHAIAATVRRVRADPGSFGFVGANGGVLSKYAAGVYATTPVPWRPDRSAGLQAEADRRPAAPQARQAGGWATVETWTLTYGRDGTRTGIVVGRMAADGRRVLARTAGDDSDVTGFLAAGEPAGARVRVRSESGINRVVDIA